MKTGRSGIVELIYGDRKKRRRRKLWICLWIGCAITQKAQSFDWAFHLFDAWQLYAGLPARHPSGSTSCCANSFPTNLSSSHETGPRQTADKQKNPMLSHEVFLFI
jgi:hypothetical protein